jgi:hypothetical protein
MKFAGATMYTKKHDARHANTQKILSDIIIENSAILRPIAELEHNNKAGTMVPKAFWVLGGEKTMDKTICVSNLLWLLVFLSRNAKAKDPQCPYIKPSTQGIYLHSLMSVMSEEYDW